MNAVILQENHAPGALGRADEIQKVLTFLVAGEVYGLSIRVIKEIIEYGGVTRVPMTADYIRGVINLRGSVVPVVDLATRLERERSPIGKRTSIVIVEVGEGAERIDIGVVVDAVNEVLDIPGSEVEPAPSFGAQIPGTYIAGMARVRGRFVTILKEETVLAVDDLAGLGGE